MMKDDGVLARVAALKTTTTPDLKAEWRKLFGAEPPIFPKGFTPIGADRLRAGRARGGSASS